MARKIATASTVFAACDRLDAANERWNREDVRNEVGGGGYAVIDPLIQAWRGLKPLREAAPSTPVELLHQVATTLETHIVDFMGEVDSRNLEAQKVFEATVSELSERLANLESELNEKEVNLQAVTADRASLVEQLEDSQHSLNEVKVAHSKLVTENDGYRGQITRLESEHKETMNKLNADAKEAAKANTTERSRVAKEHAAALKAQRKEMAEAAEQTENRLMMLLDQERQSAKESNAQTILQLSQVTEKAQVHREKCIKLETSIRELKEQNSKLDTSLVESVAHCSQLSASLAAQKTHSLTVQSEFEAYKKQYKMSGDLETLRSAVAAMQAQLDVS
tara:strand:- start:4876 stop:5886 length:1011 start_codon:yes stop_codon:yes gene_type:complete